MSNKSDAAAEVAGRNETARLHANWITAEHPRFVTDRKVEAAPSPVPARSEQSTEATPAPAPRSAKHPARLWWVYAFLISLVLPTETSIFIGPVRLAPYRVVLMLALIPCLTTLASGQAGRVRPADWLLGLHTVWAALALFMNHGLSEGIEPAGIYGIEVLGSYLIARCGIRNADDFIRTFQFLLLLVAIMLPFALYESLTGDRICRVTFHSLLGGPPLDVKAGRWGLERAMFCFDHAILFGVFCAGATGIILCLPCRTQIFRALRLGLIASTTLFSLSSGPILAIMLQLALLTWARITARIAHRWTILALAFVGGWIAVGLVSGRSPIKVFISRFTFDVQSAWARIIQWDYGTDEILRHPVFGIGLHDFARPDWVGPSVDNFWLLTAMRYGMVGFTLFVLALLPVIVGVVRLSPASDAIAQMRMGFLISVTGLSMIGVTVHFWGALFVLFLFIWGSGMWLLESRSGTGAVISAPARAAREADADAEERSLGGETAHEGWLHRDSCTHQTSSSPLPSGGPGGTRRA